MSAVRCAVDAKLGSVRSDTSLSDERNRQAAEVVPTDADSAILDYAHEGHSPRTTRYPECLPLTKTIAASEQRRVPIQAVLYESCRTDRTPT